MTLTKLKGLAVAATFAGSLLAGAGVLAYQGGDAGPKPGDAAKGSNAAPKKPAEASPDRPEKLIRDTGLYPFDVSPLPETASGVRKRNNRELFDELASEVKTWDERTVDQFIRWSRAMADVENAVNNMTDRAVNHPVHAAAAHRDRMQWLHAFTQKLSGPDQPRMADAARAAMQQAQRELDLTPRQVTVFSSGDGASKIVARLVDEAPSAAPRADNPGGAASPATGAGGGAIGAIGAGDPFREMTRFLPDGNELTDPLKMALLSSLVSAADKTPGTRAILTRLDEPVTMAFPNETPLEDVLNYIKSATAGPKEKSGIPIYVDPVGLQQAEKTMTSPVMIDLAGVPLKTTLRLLLKQLGLAYCVKDGLMYISSPEGIEEEILGAVTPEVIDAMREKLR